MGSERRRVLTVAFTDVEGSTALRTRLGDEAAERLFADLDVLLAEAVAAHEGQVVKRLGDGLLATFDSPRSALRWAAGVQERLRSDEGAPAVGVRIGINTGEVAIVDGDVSGEAVAAAARIAAIAAAGEVVTAEVVVQLAGTVPDIEVADRGAHSLKGFPSPHRLLTVRTAGTRAHRWRGGELVGRDDDLGRLDEMLRQVAAGSGQVAIVEGEAGIGKSRLLQEASVLASRSGLQVLRGAADELDQVRPFRAIFEAIQLPASPETGGDGPASQLGGELVDPSVLHVERILNELEERSATAPLVLMLEDLHWADPATVVACRAVVRRLSQLPVGVIVSARPTPRPVGFDALVEDAVAAGGLHLRLHGLAPADIAALAGEQLGADPDDALRRHLESAGGNPLYAIELVHTLSQDGSITVDGGVAVLADASVPPGLRLTILRRLSAHSEGVLNMLKTASVLGTRFAVSDLAAVLESRPTDLLADLDEVTRAGVLVAVGDDLAFAHDLIREALYEELPAPVRQALHRQVAERLLASGGSPERVGQHVALGARRGDRAAVGWLHDAARSAAATSAMAAVHLLQQALDVAEPGMAEGHDVAIDLADALIRTGHPQQAIELLQAELADGAPEVPVRRALMPALLHVGRHADSLAECERLFALPDLDAAERHGLEALASGQLLMMGRPGEAQQWAQRAVEGGEGLGDSYALALGLTNRALLSMCAGDADRALADSERAVGVAAPVVSNRSGYVTTYFVHALATLDMDHFDRAAAAIDAGRGRAERTGMVVWVASFHWLSAALRLLQGAVDEAVTDAEVAVGLAEEAESLWTGSVAPHALLAWVATQRGDLRAAADLVAEGHRMLERSGFGLASDLLLWAEAIRADAAGDRAAPGIMRAAWSVTGTFPHLPTRRIVAPDAVRLLRHGDHDAAAEVTATVVAAAELAPHVTSRAALALRCRGLLDDDPELLVQAVAAYRDTPRRWDLIATLEEAGTALAAAGRVDDAVPLLEEALSGYAEVSCARLVSRVQATLRSVGVRRRRSVSPARSRTGWESLTPTERDVVGLVVEGLTNRQIGERLYVSRRTVETHVSHVFAKLGVANRAQLAAEAAARLGQG